MKHSILFILLFYSVNTFAIDTYQYGDKLFVWAKSGLNIRKEPSPKGELVGKISFGKEITVIDEAIQTYPFSLEVGKLGTMEKTGSKKKLIFKGFWVKIRLDSVEGYVFDAYLSTLRPFKDYQNVVNKSVYNLIDIFKINFGLVRKKDKSDKSNEVYDIKYYFNQGAEIHTFNHENRLLTISIIFPLNMSLTEGYLIYEVLMKQSYDELIFISDRKIEIAPDLGELKIEIDKGRLIIYSMSGC
jgi:Bacterial SH3 domain